jgi:predicted nucleic acid-binding protein
MRIVLDTNIVAYAEGMGDKARCLLAREIIAGLPVENVLIPVQVLGELYRILTRKAGRKPVESKEAILGWSDAFATLDTTRPALESALDLAADHDFQIWDALILAISAEHRCRLLLSEDLQNGFTWRGVTVVNPFKERKHSLLKAVTGE